MSEKLTPPPCDAPSPAIMGSTAIFGPRGVCTSGSSSVAVDMDIDGCSGSVSNFGAPAKGLAAGLGTRGEAAVAALAAATALLAEARGGPARPAPARPDSRPHPSE